MTPKFACILAILMLPLPALSATDENKIFSGCGASPEEARKELGKSLHTKTESTFSSEISESKNNFFDYFTSEAKSTTTETSKMSLCNVSMEKKDGQFCASVSHKELTECAQKKLDSQMNYLTSNLPDTKSGRLKKAREWLNDIVFSDNLYTAVGKKEFDQGKLNRLITIENSLLKVLDNQYIRFNIKGTADKILVGGSKVIPPNQDIALKVGSYGYTITSPGHCKIEGNVQLTAKSRSVIEYDMSNFAYPQITFTSNTPTAQLKVGGENVSIGTTKTIQRCDGILSYSYAIQGVVKEGEVKLKPGLKTRVRKTFASPGGLATAKSYRSGKIWQAYLQNVFPTYANNNIDNLSGIKISRLTFKDSFRWGYQGAFATDSENAYSYEATGIFGLQLLDYNNGREALVLGPLVIIPVIGIEAGLGYHDLDGVSTFEDADASEWKNIYQSYIILRPKLGIDAAINKDFSISMSYSRSIYMNKSNIFSIGAGFRL